MKDHGLQNRIYTVEEYLVLDEASEMPLEFSNGIIIPKHGGTLENAHLMAGASDKHVSLAAQASRAFNNRLDNTNCQAGTSDMKVRLEGRKEFHYPDLAVWCDDARWEEAAHLTLLTPLILMEILSASTGVKDRGSKLEIYKQIPSLQDYLIVSQSRVYIEHFRRGDEPGEWRNLSYYRRDQIMKFGALGLEIPVGEIYRKVDVPEQLMMFQFDGEE